MRWWPLNRSGAEKPTVINSRKKNFINKKIKDHTETTPTAIRIRNQRILSDINHQETIIGKK